MGEVEYREQDTREHVLDKNRVVEKTDSRSVGWWGPKPLLSSWMSERMAVMPVQVCRS